MSKQLTHPAGFKLSLDFSARQLNWLHERLNAAYGDLGWWPAESRFEIVIGAILVQNTAWTNVEKALGHLSAQDCLTAEAIHALAAETLAGLIRPAGTFNIKAQRLHALCSWWLVQGGFASLDRWSTSRLRAGLMAVHGIGPETADVILLYAFKRPVFVIDAYTRRLLTRLGWMRNQPEYTSLQSVFERTLPQDANLYGQYHALIVEHAKQHCRARALCGGCPVYSDCVYGQQQPA